MIKGFDVEFDVVDAKSGEHINKTTFRKFFQNKRVVVVENAADAEQVAISFLVKYLRDKGHVVKHICKPYNGLLIDGDIRWSDFRGVKLPNN